MVFPIHRNDTIIYNNFYGGTRERLVWPSNIMRYGFPMMNCCNSFWGNMMKWQMGMSMIDMIFQPFKKQENFYPGLSLTPQQTQLQTEYNQFIAQQEQRQGLTAIQQMYGDRYRYGVIDGKLFAVTKDYSRQLSASTLTELMDAIKLDVAKHPEPVKPLEVKPADKITIDVDNDDIVYEGDADAEELDVATLPNGLIWQKATNAESYKGKTADQISEELKEQGIDVAAADIIKVSKGAFDSNYKLSNPDKLQLPNLDKSVHMAVRMNFDLNAKKATIVTADGKIYTYTSDSDKVLVGENVASQLQEDFYKEAAKALGEQAKADGWTNLTIFRKDDTEDLKELHSTGETGKNATINKDLPYTVRLVYQGGLGQGRNTSIATAFLPNGELVRVSKTETSYEDVIVALKQEIKDKGWSHVRLAKYDNSSGTPTLEYTKAEPEKEVLQTSPTNSVVQCYKLGNEYIAQGQIVFGTRRINGDYYIIAKVRVIDKNGNEYVYDEKDGLKIETICNDKNVTQAKKYLVGLAKNQLSIETNLKGHTVILTNPNGMGGDQDFRTIKVDGNTYNNTMTRPEVPTKLEDIPISAYPATQPFK